MAAKFPCAWWGCPENGILRVGKAWFCRRHAEQVKEPAWAPTDDDLREKARRAESGGKHGPAGQA